MKTCVYVLLYFNGYGDEVHFIGNREGLKLYCEENSINITKLDRDEYHVYGDYKAYEVVKNSDYLILTTIL